MKIYLDFEEPIKEIEEEIEQAHMIGNKGNADASKLIKDLEKRLDKTRKEIYKKLTPWQRVQVSRHPDRPHALDYINNLTKGQFIEMHGDRTVKDDKAMVGGLGMIDRQSVMFIGQQKGKDTKTRQYRNFGMANPEGYRKALRLMKLAEKFNIPIVAFIDTPGAYPGLEAEERGQGEAIAKNLIEMAQLSVPMICIIIGEGASGGALGIGMGDKVVMLENSWYSVISPENCSTILWRSWDHKIEAAAALKLTAEDMLKNKLIDGIIAEPLGGAHSDPETMYEIIKKEIVKMLRDLINVNKEKLIDARIKKFCSMGVVKEK